MEQNLFFEKHALGFDLSRLWSITFALHDEIEAETIRTIAAEKDNIVKQTY